jgi:hypothetical protein
MKKTAIKEVEDNLINLNYKDFYRWIVINMPRLSEVDKKSTQEKRDDVLTSLYNHPRHTGSKYWSCLELLRRKM